MTPEAPRLNLKPQAKLVAKCPKGMTMKLTKAQREALEAADKNGGWLMHGIATKATVDALSRRGLLSGFRITEAGRAALTAPREETADKLRKAPAVTKETRR